LTQVDWTFSALADLQKIRRYIEDFNPRAARETALALKEAGDSLGIFPHRGRPVPGKTLREWTLVYPYVIRYRLAEDRVVILRVRHGKQDS
jgi:addiction module RelE/StbE family toxin